MSEWTHIRNIRTKRFDVELSCTWDDYAGPNDFEKDDWDAIEAGQCGVYDFRVAVYLDGIRLTEEHLGCSMYEDPTKFAREHIGAEGQWSAYFPDMVRSACKRARQQLTKAPRMRAA